ncbi:unnamed protein product [Oncorhynchus mykiss]|uniref:Reverse transcriptase/retrotransposon-derived protein RNase H-like domain-containing protein n=1 Tax=Oncorhynchus mykiss TaxID=8022 RepID=A0A060W1B5_ONCMY|nr:unnamed protein product [Oncorhynchus mykiss]
MELKGHFISGPILIHPDPTRPFVVEVDTLDTGAGAVHSQRNEDDKKLHPCSFLSKLFSLGTQIRCRQPGALGC